MRIKCLHGFFLIQEVSVGQVSDFISRFGLSLVPWGSFFTFEDIASAPRYSLKGKALFGNIALKNFEGEPWEVFEANALVYDFSKGLVVPIAGVSQVTTVEQAGNRFLSPGLILPGSVTADGKRVKDYSAWYSRSTQRFSYSEVTYV